MHRWLLLLFPAAALLGRAAARSADSPTLRLELVAGGGSGGGGSPAAQAKLTAPFGIAFDPAGRMWFVELTGGRVGRVDRNGILAIVGGAAEAGNSGDGGAAARARFNAMHSLAIASDGSVYLADTLNNRIRRLDPRTGVVSGFAGTGEKGFGGDGGPAALARFDGIYCVALDPRGERLYLADLENRRIRAIDLKTGVVTTIAGNGERGVPADGAEARASPLVDPRAVAADAAGNVYILERSGHALRVVDPAGKIRTVAGTGKAGDSGDGGPAIRAALNGPKHLCVDRDGSVVIADTDNHRIRRYLPREGTIVAVAGSGRKGTAGLGGPAGQAELNQPHGVCVAPDGTLYIADSSNDRILRLVPRR
jgi:sugar lactone lactonase YvrE